MKITKLGLRNYRTLEAVDLEFPRDYTAICGRNDSGKTNVVRAIRCLMKEDDPYSYHMTEGPEFKVGDDFTKWSSLEDTNRHIGVTAQFTIDSGTDTGLHEFLVTYLSIDEAPTELILDVDMQHAAEQQPVVSIQIGAESISDIKAQEILKRLQTSTTFLFHSPTEAAPPFARYGQGALREIPGEHRAKLEKAQKQVENLLQRLARDQQEEVAGLLGRLNEKYKVGLSFPKFDLSYFPYNLALGDSKIEVDLREWGSGTRNRTLVLMTIFRAKQVADSTASASKVTPIIVIEEPESFLHPSAQAEFGRILQDLSEEFGVQIIVTTHSPYLLSHARPASNILLERKVTRGQLRETALVETTGEEWMKPFALSLGIRSEELKPWRDVIFSSTTSLLLVEGDVDKEYFDLFRDEGHGDERLLFDGEIFAYGGSGNLKTQTLLRFIKDRYERIFVTYDLDADDVVRKTLDALGFERRKSYLPLGDDKPGSRCIEGLLPPSVVSKVYSDHPDLVQALTGTSDERREAHRKLKYHQLEHFKQVATPGQEFYGKFYPIVAVVNQALG